MDFYEMSDESLKNMKKQIEDTLKKRSQNNNFWKNHKSLLGYYKDLNFIGVEKNDKKWVHPGKLGISIGILDFNDNLIETGNLSANDIKNIINRLNEILKIITYEGYEK